MNPVMPLLSILYQVVIGKVYASSSNRTLDHITVAHNLLGHLLTIIPLGKMSLEFTLRNVLFFLKISTHIDQETLYAEQ